MKVFVNYDNRAWRKYKIDFERIARAAATAAHADKSAQISITLTGDAEIHKLNKEYRDIDRPTNVLSFELGDATLLGDIFISLDTVLREAAAQNISVYDHTAHLVVHGVLHLMGYDHINDNDAARMEALEIKILESMGIKNPWADNCECCDDAASGEVLRSVTRGALYVVCGLAAAFGFAPFHWWFMTVLGFAGAYWLTTRTSCDDVPLWRGFVRVLPFGAAYGVAMFWWMLHSIFVVPELTRQFAVWTLPALAGIAIAGAIIFSVPFALLVRTRARCAARPFVFAGLMTALLWLREWAFTGFPWNPIANIAINMPMIANSMSLWGALGLTFVITGLIAAAVELCRVSARATRTTFTVFVILLCMGMAAGYRNILRADRGADTGGIAIRVVQPAQSQSQKMSYSRQDAITKAENNVRNMLQLATVGGMAVDLIVFPETSYPYVVNDAEMPLGALLGVPVIVGATSYSSGDLYNSMVIGDTTGAITGIYSKSHLVPFGEYRPMGIFPAPGNLARGGGAELMSLNLKGRDFVFAPAICYEIIFSDSLVPRGAGLMPDAIINITNDTWFGRTPGTYQHLDMVRRYAIESGLPIVRANYSGISAFISSAGAVTAALPIGVAGSLDGTVWGAHDTPYRTIGRDCWLIIILVFAICGALFVSRMARRER